jgi:hypothetical protein
VPAEAASPDGSTTRSHDSLEYVQKGCVETFSCTERVWFKVLENYLNSSAGRAAPTRGIYTPLYAFPDLQGVGATYIEPLYDASGGFIGAVGMDLNLEHLSYHLNRSAFMPAHPNAEVFVVEALDGHILSTAKTANIPQFINADNGQITEQNSLEEVTEFPPLLDLGSQSPLQEVQESVIFLQNYPGGLEGIDHTIMPKRQFEAPPHSGVQRHGRRGDRLGAGARPTVRGFGEYNWRRKPVCFAELLLACCRADLSLPAHWK